MKGISTIIATILMLLIVVSLSGTVYVFFSGTLSGKTAKMIELLYAEGNIIVIRNNGAENISSGEIRVIVNGQEATVVNPQIIETQKNAVLKFLPPELDMNTTNVVVFGPSNSISYTTEIKPSPFKVNEGTVGLWHFDEGSGTSTDDESVYDNDGTVTNVACTSLNCNSSSGWTSAGKFGEGMVFDGESDYVNCSNDSSLDLTNSFTIEAWVDIKSLGQTSNIVSKHDATGKSGYLFNFASTNKFQFQGGDGATWQAFYGITANTYSLGWHHAVVTNDGTNIKIYVDGTLANTTSGGTLAVNTRDLWIGRDVNSDANTFNGTIDEVKILNRSLTQEEILDEIYG